MDLRGEPLSDPRVDPPAEPPTPQSAERRRAEQIRKIENLRATVAGISFDLEAPGARQAREERIALLRHLDDYLLPRLRRLDAPLLAVVGGSTCAGKSTLVN